MCISTITREVTRWHAWLVVYAAGALLALGFAPFHWWPVALVSLPVFYLVLDASHTTKQAALRAFFFGYGYFTAGTWWISNAMLVDVEKFGWMIPISILGLSAVLAVWFALFGALFHRLKCGRLSHDMLRFALLWVAVEYLRSIGIFGFPWNLMGSMALASTTFAQVAALFGPFGLSLMVVLLGVTPLCVMLPVSRTIRLRWVLVVVLILGGGYGYGIHHLPAQTRFTETMLRVVQPNIPQSLKGTHEGQGMSIDILPELSNAPHAGFRPDITLWPETAFPFTVHGDQNRFLMPPTGMLLTGAVRAQMGEGGLAIWNSLITMDKLGIIHSTYDKHQLVPFGEFVPLRSVLPLDKITPGNIDFSRGDGVSTVHLDGIPDFSPLVCYEVIFPWMAADNDKRPAWMVNVTNDGWYGDSPGPYQHFDMARLRAIEQGLPLVRAANSGISAIIDPNGRVTGRLALDVRGVIDAPLPAPLPTTLYAIWGELLTLSFIFILWIWDLLLIRLAKNK